MSNPIIIACLVAVFSWWLFTGVILLLVRYSDRASYRIRQLYALFSAPFILVGFLLVYFSAQFSSVQQSVYRIWVLCLYGVGLNMFS